MAADRRGHNVHRSILATVLDKLQRKYNELYYCTVQVNFSKGFKFVDVRDEVDAKQSPRES